MEDKQYFNVKDLIPGMVIAEDVYDSMHHLIVPENTQITDSLILRLDFYSIKNVLIANPDMPLAPDNTPQSYSQRIKASAEYKEFKQNYFSTADIAKDALNSIVTKNASEESITQLFNSTDQLLHSGNTSIHIFDMLHNLRYYLFSLYQCSAYFCCNWKMDEISRRKHSDAYDLWTFS